MTNLFVSLSTVEEVVSQVDTKSAEVMNKKRHAALIAVPCDSGNVRNVRILCCRQAGARLQDCLACGENLRALILGNPQAVRARGDIGRRQCSIRVEL